MATFPTVPLIDHFRMAHVGIQATDVEVVGAAAGGIAIGYPDRFQVISLTEGDKVLMSSEDVDGDKEWIEVGRIPDTQSLIVSRGRYKYVNVTSAIDVDVQFWVTHHEWGVHGIAGITRVMEVPDPCDDQPTMANSKSEILDWLEDVGITGVDSLTKSELLNLVDDYCSP